MAPPEIVRRLVEVFGARFVALVGGVKNTRTVRHWLTGEKRPDHLDRLVFTLQVVVLMQEAGESNEVINAWFRGMNSRLEDDSPVLVIADNPLLKIQRIVMAAARAFICSASQVKHAYTVWNSEAARKAREFGIDLTLTRQNLALTPTERLEKHEAWVNEVAALQRAFQH